MTKHIEEMISKGVVSGCIIGNGWNIAGILSARSIKAFLHMPL